MKKKRNFLILLVFLLVLLFVLAFAKNIIAQVVITSGVKAITGLEVKTGGVNASIRKTFLGINGLTVFNPPQFSDRVMVNMPEVYVDYNLGDFFKGKAHFEELRINLEELIVVRNQANQVNIKSLKALLPKGEGKPPQIQIDGLTLKISRVIYKDYVLGSPETREFNVNITEKIENVTDPQALVRLILMRALSKTNIAGLAGIDLDKLKQDISESLLRQGGGAVEELKGKAQEKLEEVEDKFRDIFNK
ncbi:MAG: hypothetical protein PHE18_01430 [Candidatus Omnitrophica bacterium]|nr:hypothetical protein [Candidatus Omnitrophota bacterium]MDD5552517.1 hypothetical protein [Candidatus Omnitrophota bacterium]